MKILDKYKKRKRIKELQKLKKKYRGIYLSFLVIISFILNNYNIALKENDKLLEESFSFNFSAPNYLYSNEKGYVYVKDDSDEVIKEKIITSTTENIEGDKLYLLDGWGNPLGTYFLIRLDLSNYNVNNKTITINKKITYNEFVSNIKTNATLKIYKDEEEINSGYIVNGMVMKLIYKNDEIDYYNIDVDVLEYADVSKLNIKDNQIIINKLSKVEELTKLIDTTGNISVINKDGKILSESDNISTCSKLKIELSNEIIEYTIVVMGDITGSGDIFIGDISKLHQYFMELIEMDSCYVNAGDVTNDNEISINDISKLYQYFMGIIDSL